MTAETEALRLTGYKNELFRGWQTSPKEPNKSTKSGHISFYMNDELVRSKRYAIPFYRRQYIKTWEAEIRPIRGKNIFHYIITPEL
jgi:hypothetical protein